MSALTKVYEQISLERPRVCSNCGGTQYLSHSHLVPRSLDRSLIANKENITLHCMSRGETIGCHDLYTSLNAVFMKDFTQNMLTVHRLNRQYFWQRYHKLYYGWKSSTVTNASKANQILRDLNHLVAQPA